MAHPCVGLFSLRTRSHLHSTAPAQQHLKNLEFYRETQRKTICGDAIGCTDAPHTLLNGLMRLVG